MDEKKPRCPRCRAATRVTRHSHVRRADGSSVSRWLCRRCAATFLRKADRRRDGNYCRRVER